MKRPDTIDAIETHLRMIHYHVKQMSDCEAIDNYDLVLLELGTIRKLLTGMRAGCDCIAEVKLSESGAATCSKCGALMPAT